MGGGAGGVCGTSTVPSKSSHVPRSSSLMSSAEDAAEELVGLARGGTYPKLQTIPPVDK